MLFWSRFSCSLEFWECCERRALFNCKIHSLLSSCPILSISLQAGTIPSQALPYEVAPAALDGTLPGDVGFDPCFLSSKADTMVPYFNGIFQGRGPTDGLVWYREAELMHGRICMIAVVGFIAPGFGTIPGNEWSDSFGYTNPLEAFSGAPTASLFQIFGFMSLLEFRRISIIVADGSSYQPGASQKWGQGDGDFWNPLGLSYTPAEYAEKQLQEIKHARLAMIGFLGLVFQAEASGVSVVDQLSSAFVTPGYVAKAGYFLPEGI
jgi:Chlorophyll A-B binding protein